MISTQALWTGRLELELVDHLDSPIGVLEFSIRVDIMTVWWGNRTLSVVDRDLFRSWLQHPARPLQMDDLVWSIQATSIALSIDDRVNYLLPHEFVAHLVEVI